MLILLMGVVVGIVALVCLYVAVRDSANWWFKHKRLRQYKVRKRLEEWVEHRLGHLPNRSHHFGRDEETFSVYLYRVVQGYLCRQWGHLSVQCACRMPLHDFCLWCNTRTPYDAVPRKLAMDGSYLAR